MVMAGHPAEALGRSALVLQAREDAFRYGRAQQHNLTREGKQRGRHDA